MAHYKAFKLDDKLNNIIKMGKVTGIRLLTNVKGFIFFKGKKFKSKY